MNIKNRTSCLAAITLAASLLASCERNTGETADAPAFSTDTTGDRVLHNTVVTYNIYKSRLYPYRVYDVPDGFDSSEWAAEQNDKEQHEKIFKVFVDLIPERFRPGVKYFSIQASGIASMGPHKVNSLETFALTVSPFLLEGQDQIPAFSATENLNNTLGYDFLHYSLIHEFGHYVTMNRSQAVSYNVYKPESLMQGIIDITWDKMSDEANACMLDRYDRTGKLNLYPCKPEGEFVTGYAGSNFSEDAAETFAHFVLLDNMPAPGTHANDKILLFYKDPEMLKIREGIRDNLKKMNIVPRPPNMPGKSI